MIGISDRRPKHTLKFNVSISKLTVKEGVAQLVAREIPVLKVVRSSRAVLISFFVTLRPGADT